MAKMDGVELVLPHGLAPDDPRVLAFVAAKGSWILRTRAGMEARRDTQPRPQRYRDGETFHLRGEALPLRIVGSDSWDAESVVLREEAGHKEPRDRAAIEIRLAREMDRQADAGADAAFESAARTTLLAWLREQALSDARSWSRDASTRLGREPSDLRLFDARTRWGSCSPKGVVRVHWRLAQAPPEIFEYVLVHELCHLRELNHGPRFWAWMAELMPDYTARKAALRAWERGGDARRDL